MRDLCGAVAANKRLFEEFWLGKDVDKPPLSFSWWPKSKSSVLTRVQLESDQLDFDIQMEGINELTEALPSLEGVYVPCIRPYFGITLIAEGFGAEVEYPDWDCPWVRKRPVETIEEAAALSVDEFLASEAVAKVMRRLNYMLDRAPEHVTVKATDLQGPLNNAGLVLGFEELAVAMYEKPELAHLFLAKMADAQIELCLLQKKAVESAGRQWCADWDMVWYPPDKNGYIAADNALLLSPAMYQEFVAPQDERVLNTVSKGGVMHNCGPILSSLEPFNSIANCIAVTFDMAINWKDLRAICQKLGPKGRFFTCSYIPGKNLVETLRLVDQVVSEYEVGYSFFACFADRDSLVEAYRFWRDER